MEILSIIIPTYNRAESLVKQVHALLPQLTDEVRLIVIDNKSSYDIHSLFTDEEKQYFTIIVNNINIGGAANIAKCFEICESQWLWTLSDDDIVVEDAVNCVLDSIKDKDDTIMVNFFALLEGSSYKGLQEFAKMTMKNGAYGNLFYMSCCVYNMNIVRDYMHIYYRAISTMQPGIILLTRILDENPSYKVDLIKKTICKDDGNNISWNREKFIYASLYILDLLRDLKPKLKRSLFDSIYFMCLDEVRLSRNAGMSFIHSMLVYKRIASRFGYIDSIIYHGKTIIRHLIRLILFKLKIR